MGDGTSQSWRDAELIAVFAINLLVLLVLAGTLVHRCFAKWVYSGQLDSAMTIALPLTIFWFIITIIFQQVLVGSSESGYFVANWFYLSFFQTLIVSVFDLHVLFILPRLIIQQLKEIGAYETAKSLSIVSLGTWIVQLILEGVHVGMTSYLNYRSYKSLTFPHDLLKQTLEIEFTFSLIYVFYAVILFGFASKLGTSRELHNETANLITLLVILPCFLVARTIVSACYGLFLFAHAQREATVAFNIVASLTGTAMLCSISFIGTAYSGRVRRRPISKPLMSSNDKSPEE